MTQEKQEGLIHVTISTMGGPLEATLEASECTPENGARAALVSEAYGREGIEGLRTLAKTAQETQERLDRLTDAFRAQNEILEQQQRQLRVLLGVVGVVGVISVTAAVMSVRSTKASKRTEETLERQLWLDVKASNDKRAALANLESLSSSLATTGLGMRSPRD